MTIDVTLMNRQHEMACRLEAQTHLGLHQPVTQIPVGKAQNSIL